MLEDRPIKWKRRKPWQQNSRALTAKEQHPREDAARLSSLRLQGTLDREAAWLLVPPEVATLLDRACLGRATRRAPPPAAASRP